MATITVDDPTLIVLKNLQEQARQRGLTLAAYLEGLARLDFAPSALPRLTAEQFEAVLDQLAAMNHTAPSLPVDFSRADLYSDHD
jgi:hypothetical protein